MDANEIGTIIGAIAAAVTTVATVIGGIIVKIENAKRQSKGIHTCVLTGRKLKKNPKNKKPE